MTNVMAARNCQRPARVSMVTLAALFAIAFILTNRHVRGQFYSTSDKSAPRMGRRSGPPTAGGLNLGSDSTLVYPRFRQRFTDSNTVPLAAQVMKYDPTGKRFLSSLGLLAIPLESIVQYDSDDPSSVVAVNDGGAKAN